MKRRWRSRTFPPSSSRSTPWKSGEDNAHLENPVDLMFDALEAEKPNHFAVRQYKKYKLAAGRTAKSILISCGARLAVLDIGELREVTAYDELELGHSGRPENCPVPYHE